MTTLDELQYHYKQVRARLWDAGLARQRALQADPKEKAELERRAADAAMREAERRAEQHRIATEEETARIAERRSRALDRFDTAMALVRDNPSGISMASIAREVASKHGITVERLRSHARTRAMCRARDEAVLRCVEETKNSYSAIGRFFDNRDHTTIGTAVTRERARLAMEQTSG